MCSGQPTQSANPVRGLWPHSVAICCRALPSPAPFRVERSESQVVKSSSASSASYSHSASSANISTICLFMHSHCVAKANALRANALWPLSSPGRSQYASASSHNPFLLVLLLFLFLSLEIFGAAVSFVPPPHVALPLSRACLPPCYLSRPYPSLPFRSCAFTTCQSFEQN